VEVATMSEPGIVLKPVLDLSPTESEEIARLVADQKDFGLSYWSRTDLPCRPVFAAFRGPRFVGMCCWAGVPEQAQPYAWIHRNERRQGCGSAMIDALSASMNALGVTGLAAMPIVATGHEIHTAVRLGVRLRAHFRP
jgi:hypothetical protein